jgi:sugar fermentation stimulation protein A
MESCLGTGWPVRLSDSHNPKRKYRLTWEMVHNGRCWIGINTQHPNRLVHEAINAGTIEELAGYDRIRPEVRYGDRSRIDLLLESGHGTCYVEVKNVTLVDDQGCYAFPDAVTERGRKHLIELQKVVDQGHRAVMMFVIQRSDGAAFTTADHIDPAYGIELRRAIRAGVEVLAYRAEVTPERIELTEACPVNLVDSVA